MSSAIERTRQPYSKVFGRDSNEQRKVSNETKNSGLSKKFEFAAMSILTLALVSGPIALMFARKGLITLSPAALTASIFGSWAFLIAVIASLGLGLLLGDLN